MENFIEEESREDIFPWIKVIRKKQRKSFPEVNNEIIQLLLDNIHEEFKNIVECKNKKRAKILHDTIINYYLQFYCKVRCNKVQDMKILLVQLLYYLVYLGLILSNGNASSQWMDKVLVLLKTFPEDFHLICDALLLIQSLKKKNHQVYAMIIQNLFLKMRIKSSDVESFIKILLLLRRLKFLAQEDEAKSLVSSLALELKCPFDFDNWISLNCDNLCNINSKNAVRKILNKKLSPGILTTLFEVLFTKKYPERIVKWIRFKNTQKSINEKKTPESSSIRVKLETSPLVYAPEKVYSSINEVINHSICGNIDQTLPEVSNSIEVQSSVTVSNGLDEHDSQDELEIYDHSGNIFNNQVENQNYKKYSLPKHSNSIFQQNNEYSIPEKTSGIEQCAEQNSLIVSENNEKLTNNMNHIDHLSPKVCNKYNLDLQTVQMEDVNVEQDFSKIDVCSPSSSSPKYIIVERNILDGVCKTDKNISNNEELSVSFTSSSKTMSSNFPVNSHTCNSKKSMDIGTIQDNMHNGTSISNSDVNARHRTSQNINHEKHLLCSNSDSIMSNKDISQIVSVEEVVNSVNVPNNLAQDNMQSEDFNSSNVLSPDTLVCENYKEINEKLIQNFKCSDFSNVNTPENDISNMGQSALKQSLSSPKRDNNICSSPESLILHMDSSNLSYSTDCKVNLSNSIYSTPESEESEFFSDDNFTHSSSTSPVIHKSRKNISKEFISETDSDSLHFDDKTQVTDNIQPISDSLQIKTVKNVHDSPNNSTHSSSVSPVIQRNRKNISKEFISESDSDSTDNQYHAANKQQSILNSPQIKDVKKNVDNSLMSDKCSFSKSSFYINKECILDTNEASSSHSSNSSAEEVSTSDESELSDPFQRNYKKKSKFKKRKIRKAASSSRTDSSHCKSPINNEKPARTKIVRKQTPKIIAFPESDSDSSGHQVIQKMGMHEKANASIDHQDKSFNESLNPINLVDTFDESNIQVDKKLKASKILDVQSHSSNSSGCKSNLFKSLDSISDCATSEPEKQSISSCDNFSHIRQLPAKQVCTLDESEFSDAYSKNLKKSKLLRKKKTNKLVSSSDSDDDMDKSFENNRQPHNNSLSTAESPANYKAVGKNKTYKSQRKLLVESESDSAKHDLMGKMKKKRKSRKFMLKSDSDSTDNTAKPFEKILQHCNSTDTLGENCIQVNERLNTCDTLCSTPLAHEKVGNSDGVKLKRCSVVLDHLDLDKIGCKILPNSNSSTHSGIKTSESNISDILSKNNYASDSRHTPLSSNDNRMQSSPENKILDMQSHSSNSTSPTDCKLNLFKSVDSVSNCDNSTHSSQFSVNPVNQNDISDNVNNTEVSQSEFIEDSFGQEVASGSTKLVSDNAVKERKYKPLISDSDDYLSNERTLVSGNAKQKKEKLNYKNKFIELKCALSDDQFDKAKKSSEKKRKMITSSLNSVEFSDSEKFSQSGRRIIQKKSKMISESDSNLNDCESLQTSKTEQEAKSETIIQQPEKVPYVNSHLPSKIEKSSISVTSINPESESENMLYEEPRTLESKKDMFSKSSAVIREKNLLLNDLLSSSQGNALNNLKSNNFYSQTQEIVNSLNRPEEYLPKSTDRVTYEHSVFEYIRNALKCISVLNGELYQKEEIDSAIKCLSKFMSSENSLSNFSKMSHSSNMGHLETSDCTNSSLPPHSKKSKKPESNNNFGNLANGSAKKSRMLKKKCKKQRKFKKFVLDTDSDSSHEQTNKITKIQQKAKFMSSENSLSDFSKKSHSSNFVHLETSVCINSSLPPCNTKREKYESNDNFHDLYKSSTAESRILKKKERKRQKIKEFITDTDSDSSDKQNSKIAKIKQKTKFISSENSLSDFSKESHSSNVVHLETSDCTNSSLPPHSKKSKKHESNNNFGDLANGSAIKSRMLKKKCQKQRKFKKFVLDTDSDSSNEQTNKITKIQQKTKFMSSENSLSDFSKKSRSSNFVHLETSDCINSSLPPCNTKREKYESNDNFHDLYKSSTAELRILKKKEKKRQKIKEFITDTDSDSSDEQSNKITKIKQKTKFMCSENSLSDFSKKSHSSNFVHLEASDCINSSLPPCNTKREKCESNDKFHDLYKSSTAESRILKKKERKRQKIKEFITDTDSDSSDKQNSKITKIKQKTKFISSENSLSDFSKESHSSNVVHLETSDCTNSSLPANSKKSKKHESNNNFGDLANSPAIKSRMLKKKCQKQRKFKKFVLDTDSDSSDEQTNKITKIQQKAKFMSSENSLSDFSKKSHSSNFVHLETSDCINSSLPPCNTKREKYESNDNFHDLYKSSTAESRILKKKDRKQRKSKEFITDTDSDSSDKQNNKITKIKQKTKFISSENSLSDFSKESHSSNVVHLETSDCTNSSLPLGSRKRKKSESNDNFGDLANSSAKKSEILKKKERKQQKSKRLVTDTDSDSCDTQNNKITKIQQKTKFISSENLFSDFSKESHSSNVVHLETSVCTNSSLQLHSRKRKKSESNDNFGDLANSSAKKSRILKKKQRKQQKSKRLVTDTDSDSSDTQNNKITKIEQKTKFISSENLFSDFSKESHSSNVMHLETSVCTNSSLPLRSRKRKKSESNDNFGDLANGSAKKSGILKKKQRKQPKSKRLVTDTDSDSSHTQSNKITKIQQKINQQVENLVNTVHQTSPLQSVARSRNLTNDPNENNEISKIQQQVNQVENSVIAVHENTPVGNVHICTSDCEYHSLSSSGNENSDYGLNEPISVVQNKINDSRRLEQQKENISIDSSSDSKDLPLSIIEEKLKLNLNSREKIPLHSVEISNDSSNDLAENINSEAVKMSEVGNFQKYNDIFHSTTGTNVNTSNNFVEVPSVPPKHNENQSPNNLFSAVQKETGENMSSYSKISMEKTVNNNSIGILEYSKYSLHPIIECSVSGIFHNNHLECDGEYSECVKTPAASHSFVSNLSKTYEENVQISCINKSNLEQLSNKLQPEIVFSKFMKEPKTCREKCLKDTVDSKRRLLEIHSEIKCDGNCFEKMRIKFQIDASKQFLIINDKKIPVTALYPVVNLGRRCDKLWLNLKKQTCLEKGINAPLVSDTPHKRRNNDDTCEKYLLNASYEKVKENNSCDLHSNDYEFNFSFNGTKCVNASSFMNCNEFTPSTKANKILSEQKNLSSEKIQHKQHQQYKENSSHSFPNEKLDYGRVINQCYQNLQTLLSYNNLKEGNSSQVSLCTVNTASKQSKSTDSSMKKVSTKANSQDNIKEKKPVKVPLHVGISRGYDLRSRKKSGESCR